MVPIFEESEHLNEIISRFNHLYTSVVLYIKSRCTIDASPLTAIRLTLFTHLSPFLFTMIARDCSRLLFPRL